MDDIARTWNPAQRIVEAGRAFPDNAALTVKGECWTYAELLAAARYLAGRLPPVTSLPRPATAVMADREPSSYVGILACILRGHTYVPINVRHPAAHNAQILHRAGVRQVVCGSEARGHFDAICEVDADLSERVSVVACPDRKAAFPRMIADSDLEASIAKAATAYILFTSGSTGVPKGVPIDHGNLTSYLDAVDSVMDVGSDDRASQTFDLTFDLSVHDLLVTWTHGAHLIVPQPCDLASPAQFIRDEMITCWFSVPTLAYQVHLQGRLQPGAFPSLRWSLFCGEALPLDLARRWQLAAPSSRVENWYGPTEATIACARFDLAEPLDSGDAPNDLAPIGRAFPNMALTVVGSDMTELPAGEAGELLLSGAQVAVGYLGDDGKTAQSFVPHGHPPVTYYRTGDRAVRDADGRFWFLGRVDAQVKIRGFRVELGAIETVVRKAGVTANAVALSWPPDAASGSSVVVAVEAERADVDVDVVLELARRELPDYMVPSRIACMPTFPTNASGKADRKAIAARLQTSLQTESEAHSHADLDPLEQDVIRTLLRLNPHLDRSAVLAAENMLASGLDSLGIIQLTAELERQHGLELTQDDVITMADASFSGMARYLRMLIDGASEGADGSMPSDASTPAVVTLRANRALQFIEEFPSAARAGGPPLVLALGSSGVFRGFDPQCFDERLAAAGRPVRSFNVGLPALDSAGLARIATFISQQCAAAGSQPLLVIYELDPVLISVSSPRRSMTLTDADFEGRVPSSDRVDADFRWDAHNRGAPVGSASRWSVSRRRRFGRRFRALARDRGEPQAEWVRTRQRDIARTYLGDVPFRTDAMDEWLQGARTLQASARHVLGFVHPVSKGLLREVSAAPLGEHWHNAFNHLRHESGVPFLGPESFALKDADFFNINHVGLERGRPELTSQIAARCVALLEGE